MAVTPAFDIPPQARSPVSANVSTTAPRNDQMTALGHDRPYLPVGLPVPLPTHTEAQPLFTALQKWQGTVSQVTDSTFSAVLLDLLEPSVEEVAEFDLEEVSRGDLDLIAPGAVFYWSIGYRTEPSGERSRSSVLVFRRLPAWSEKDLQRATDNAKELRNNFGW
ncbi:MAG: hypothetical protein F4138_00550 [Acidimicrobiia bacterium]|nr:hypothetical protein [Acidimicrobiia bacterium]MYC58302.1 hypothetical protein [Acidimicrobiia bacterium]MYG93477.1 hypothetical protein [Acidimicrobiia bacterium]